ncbi:type II toxin-antitoxin system CcdA family antitoxin [Chitinimonas koreensis]|uniref:type II toxin-antitoxin system CcdA family antitoxin n=1 Tax=Chitinimonas koreensis TaxID=356302 RepID=UPI000426D794|nr:type II toxin-antitoxin system CcdA family antitoxin [Chitinimonas koreensis]QNM95261.1 type II toxin-antitoxin system CcdA family antitoxin [Chitinimonas koreensis]
MNRVAEQPAEYAAEAKKAANLSINAALLAEAKALGINLSQAFEAHLAVLVREEKARRWKEANREAIEGYNRYVEEHGVFSDGWRSW